MYFITIKILFLNRKQNPGRPVFWPVGGRIKSCLTFWSVPAAFISFIWFRVELGWPGPAGPKWSFSPHRDHGLVWEVPAKKAILKFGFRKDVVRGKRKILVKMWVVLSWNRNIKHRRREGAVTFPECLISLTDQTSWGGEVLSWGLIDRCVKQRRVSRSTHINVFKATAVLGKACQYSWGEAELVLLILSYFSSPLAQTFLKECFLQPVIWTTLSIHGGCVLFRR